jgi:arabinose-5-phosphate isomerase
LPNLSHGDFGLLQDNDVIIFISNSGNTRENVETLKYIKNVLRKKITTISIVANNDSEMQKHSNFTYILSPIYEADMINMTPSTSSLLFMALLDGIAIYSKKDITKEEFQHCHPAGSIGKL